jgi:hypothetical protein
MRGVECIHHLRRDPQRRVERQRPLRRPSFQVLHHQVVGADVVEDADVRVAEGGNRARFLLEALSVGGRQRLDGDCTAKAGVDRP